MGAGSQQANNAHRHPSMPPYSSKTLPSEAEPRRKHAKQEGNAKPGTHQPPRHTPTPTPTHTHRTQPRSHTQAQATERCCQHPSKHTHIRAAVHIKAHDTKNMPSPLVQ